MLLFVVVCCVQWCLWFCFCLSPEVLRQLCCFLRCGEHMLLDAGLCGWLWCNVVNCFFLFFFCRWTFWRQLCCVFGLGGAPMCEMGCGLVCYCVLCSMVCFVLFPFIARIVATLMLCLVWRCGGPML